MKTKTMLVSVFCSFVLSYSVLCWADEPVLTSVQSGESVVQEVVGLRDANTRVWENVREVPVTDDETGKTELVSVRSQVYEKADNLCYNRSTTDKPDWVPTVEEITTATEKGFAYAAKQGAYQVSFVGDLTAPWSIVYSPEKQQLRLGVRYLGYYDTSNGSSVFISSVASVVPKLISPNKLCYSNAFPGIDIEYVYTKGRFLQNAVINSLSSYPSPAKYGMNPQTTQLIIATELDLADNPALAVSINNQKYTGLKLDAEGKYPIVISNATTGKQLCQFEPNGAFDNSTIEQRQERAVTQQLLSLNDKHYLIEGVPLNWLTSATLPVTIDYELKSGGINGNETWQSGKTYYVSGPVTVNNGYILVIQGGTIIKFTPSAFPNPGGSITVASGGKIIAQGSKFKYIVFTSANDDSIGEGTQHGGPAPYYSYAIRLESGSSEGSKIRYCKITKAIRGIEIDADLATTNPIQNNIIRNNVECGIKVDTNGNAVLKNNLIVSAYWGVLVNGSATIQLATIDQAGGHGVYVNGNATVIDTLISNSPYSLYSTSYCTLNHNYNCFYKAPLGPSINQAPNEYILTQDQDTPYKVSPNGSYYLRPINSDPYDPNYYINPCISPGGSMSAIDAEMQWKTTSCPTTFTASNWNLIGWLNKVDRDVEQVNIGYHYEPVDVVVGTNSDNYRVEVTGNVNLSIDSGVVVSFYRNASNKWARLKFANGAKINAVGYDAVGSDTAFIQFTSLYATSDLIQAPLCGGLDIQDYSGALLLHAGAHPDSNIQYCDFKYAQIGVRLLQSLNITRPIQNNYFEQNLYGIALDSSGNNIVNNLFVNNRNGFAIRLTDSPPPKVISYIQSNTFYSNDTAVLIKPETSGRTIITRLENNIFSSNIAGAIGINATGGTIQAETRNNLYWNNELNVDGTYISINNSNTENKDIVNEYCPMLVHKAQLSNNQRIETSFPHDGFYLGQRTGDASRFPLRQYDLTGVDISGISQQPASDALIKVYSSNGYNDQTELGEYSLGEEYSDGNDHWGNILIEFVDDGINHWQLADGDYLELTFASSNKVRVYLPELGTVRGNLYLWVAQDGSSYYGTKNFLAQWEEKQEEAEGLWFPMYQHDMVNIDFSISQSDDGNHIYVYASDSLNENVLLGYYYTGTDPYELDPPRYTDGSDSWGNIVIEFDGYWRIYGGDYIDLYFASNQTKRVYLPDIGIVEGSLYLYIAEDGSCYFDTSDQAQISYEWSLDQDAYFAMQYDMPSITGLENTGLAMSAYDGRYAQYGTQAQARSPAVDKGAVKVTLQEFVGTENDVKYSIFASKGTSKTDETADNSDTYRVIPVVIGGEHFDPLGILDIGYHYRDSVFYTTDIIYGVENMELGSRHADYPDDWTCERKAIVSGLSNSDEPDTIIAYPLTGSSPYSYSAGYHIYNTPINKKIDSSFILYPLNSGTPPPGRYQGIGNVSGCVSPNGNMFAGICYGYEVDDEPNYRYYTGLMVYRYQPESMDWILIATFERTTNYEPPGIALTDISIASDNSDVWVSWVWNETDATKLQAALVPANPSSLVVVGSAQAPINDLINPFVDGSPQIPNMTLTYDPLIDRTPPNQTDGDVRLMYIDRTVNPKVTKEIPLLTNKSLSPPTIQLDPAFNNNPAVIDTGAYIPRIVYNPFNNPNANNQQRAYAVNKTDTGYVRAFDLATPGTSSDTWQLDAAFNNTISGSNPDITYRANSLKFVVWDNGNEIQSNLFLPMRINHATLPRLATQGVNQRDIYLTWADEYDVNSDSNLENVLILRELYP